jgi:hypothetical protein
MNLDRHKANVLVGKASIFSRQNVHLGRSNQGDAVCRRRSENIGGALRGRVTLNYKWPAFDQDSVVVVTASEYNAEHVRFIGPASITVANVTPHGPPYDPNHGVTFVLNASGSSPLNIVTDINLLDDKPIDTQIRSPGSEQHRPPHAVPGGRPDGHDFAPCPSARGIVEVVNAGCHRNPAPGQTINKFPPGTSACRSARCLQQTLA